MTAAEQRAEQLDALAKLRELQTMADEAIGTLERVLIATAVTMPPLIEPERPERVAALEAAKILGVEKAALCHPPAHNGCPPDSVRYSRTPSPHPRAPARTKHVPVSAQ